MMHCMFPLLHPTRHLSGQKEKNYILSFICCRRATITFFFICKPKHNMKHLTAPSLYKKMQKKGGKRILGGLEGREIGNNKKRCCPSRNKIKSAYPGILKQPLLDLFSKSSCYKDFEGHFVVVV